MPILSISSPFQTASPMRPRWGMCCESWSGKDSWLSKVRKIYIYIYKRKRKQYLGFGVAWRTNWLGTRSYYPTISLFLYRQHFFFLLFFFFIVSFIISMLCLVWSSIREKKLDVCSCYDQLQNVYLLVFVGKNQTTWFEGPGS